MPKISNQHEIGLDLEFDRNSFGYGFVMCLIQVSAENEVYLIDPLAIDNLKNLFAVFEEPSITKILHNASEDVLLLKENGCSPKNIWDTEKAAMILNHQKTGLGNLLDDYLGVKLEKDVRRTNWRKRPLTQNQLSYAMKDVKHLGELKKHLKEGLIRANRLNWVEQEGEIVENLEMKEKENPFLNYKNAKKLHPDQKKRLKALYLIRERWAEKLDRPPYQILSNHTLVEISISEIDSINKWNNIKGLNPEVKNLTIYEEFKEIESTLDSSEFIRSKFGHSNKDQRLEEMLKTIRLEVQRDYGEQCAKLIISQSLMDDIQNDRELLSLKPYAREVILQYADNLGYNFK